MNLAIGIACLVAATCFCAYAAGRVRERLIWERKTSEARDEFNRIHRSWVRRGGLRRLHDDAGGD